MAVRTLLFVDSAAIIGFVAALLGAAVGALGTYYATVGAARQQGRARVRAALRAIRLQVEENRAELQMARQRLLRQHRQLSRLVEGVRAGRAKRPYELDGQQVALDSQSDLARLLGGPLDFGLHDLNASAWTTVLAPDAAFLKPQQYSAVVEYEGLIAMLRDLNRQILPLMMDTAFLLTDADPLTLEALVAMEAAGQPLLNHIRRLDLLIQTLHDLFNQLEAISTRLLAASVVSTRA